MEREHRFLLDRPRSEALLATAARELWLEVHDRARPVAYTRTTYLDTDRLDYLRSCTHGPVARRVRIREYAAATDVSAEPELTGLCFIERKESTGAERSKQRAAVAPDQLCRLMAGDRDAADAVPVPPWLAEVLAGLAGGRLSPRLTSWYRRACLRDDSGDVRVTMDEGIAYCRPTLPGAGPAAPEVVQYGPSRLIEVKLRAAAPAWLERALAGLPQAEAFSKFRMGMRVISLADRFGGTGRRTEPITIGVKTRSCGGRG